MAFDIGSVIAHVKADLTEFTGAMNQAQNQVNSLGDNIGNVAENIRNFAQQASIFVGIEAAGFGLVANYAVDAASNFEQTRISLDAMTGSAQKGAAAMKILDDFARAAPLIPVQEIMDAGKQLLAFGFTLDGTASSMDNASSSGKKATTTVNAFGETIKKVSATNADQLAAANTKLAEQNAQLKILEEEHPKAGIATDRHTLAVMKLKDAIAATNIKIGDHTLSVETMTGTYSPAITHADDLKTVLQEVGEAAVAMHKPISQVIDIFNQAKEGIFNQRIYGAIGAGRQELEKFGASFTAAGKMADSSTLLPALQALIDKKFGTIFAKEQGTFAGSVQNLKDDFTRIAAALMGVDAATGLVFQGSMFQKMEQGVNAIYKFVDAHLAMIEAIGKNKTVQLAIEGLALAIGALVIIIPTLLIIFNPVILIVLAIEAAIVALFVAWNTNFLGIRTITEQVGKYIMDFWNSSLKPAIKILTDWWHDNWQYIYDFLAGIWYLIRGIFEIITAFVILWIRGLLDVLTLNWKDLWKTMQTVLGLGWDGIQKILEGALIMVSNAIAMIIQAIVKPFEDAWNTVSGIMNKIKDALDFTKRHSPSVLDVVQNGVKLVNDALSGLAFNNSFNLNPHTTFSPLSNITPTSQQIVINLDGAIIADANSAMRIGEVLGDAMIKKLQQNIRV